MKDYDLAFSLGFSCGTSQALRAAGMQFASLPLDWTGSPGVVASARIVAGDFAGWFEAEDLELVDVRHGTGFCTRIYRNRKTGLGYSHEFSDFEPFSATYPVVRRTYERRVERFLAMTRECRRMLAVYMELPIRRRAPDEDVAEARRTLAERFPGAEVDLLYVFVEPGRARPEISALCPNVEVASFDYRKYDNGEVTHFIDWGPLVPLLRANYRVADVRSAAARDDFAAFKKLSGEMRWGPDKSRFRRWINKHAYKTYRSLEQLLVRKGLVHREGPLWFVPVRDQPEEVAP